MAVFLVLNINCCFKAWGIEVTDVFSLQITGYGQALEYFGQATYWDTFCKNQCWEKSISGWEVEDRCSSNPCSDQECQSRWLCGMYFMIIHWLLSYRSYRFNVTPLLCESIR